MPSVELVDKVGSPAGGLRGSGGALHAMDAPRSTQYDAVITSDGVGVVVALAAGVALGDGRVIASNLDATNGAFMAQGISAGEAVANLNIASGVATRGTYLPPDSGSTEKIRGVGDLNTHVAIATAVIATTPQVNLEQVV